MTPMTSMAGTPTFSVLTAVFDPVPEHLAACLDSVAGQTGPPGDVEHVVVDDGSTDPAVHVVLDRTRASVHRRAVNGGIVAASNDALAAATGEWLVLLDHDDELATGAIDRVRVHLADRPDAVVVYSDHDVIRPDGRRADPVFKPDFSPERLRQTNYITHLVVVRRDAVEAVGGFRAGTDGAQDHDLLLRLMEAGHRFEHIAEVLAHWRQSPASVATDTGNKPAAFDAGLDVVAAHIGRAGVDATVEPGSFPGVYRVRRRVDADALVSVVIPTNGSRGRVWGCERTFVVDAIASLVGRSTHRRLEFVVVADRDTPGRAIRGVGHAIRSGGSDDIGLQIVEFDEEFNFSRKLNRGVEAASGDLLLLLNDDTELLEPESVATMIGHLQQPGVAGGPVGAVGAKLLYDDGTLQHGGHVYHGEFMHAFLGWPGDHPGPQRLLAVERECSGVTAAACLTTRDVLDEIGGFPEDLPLHFNDVDACRSIRATGRRILWTPHASWYHFEGRSRSRGATMAEWERAAVRWPGGVPHDPYSNPNLTPKRDDWLELPDRSGAPPYVVDADGITRWA